MANELANLIKKRGSIKCRLTRLRRFVDSFAGSDLTDQQRTELKLRSSGSQLLQDFNNIQGLIEELSPESELEKQLEFRDDFEREYYATLASVECMTRYDEAHSTCIELPAVSANNIKLPTISIPDFDGSCEHWLEFRDTFLSLVHNSTSITSIQKFHYLKSSLKGNAKAVIDSLEFSASNYEVAWELLLNRFDNTKLLVHNHLKSIFSMQSLFKESPVHLRKLIDNILKNLRALKLLGEPTEYWDTLIIYIVGSKLDSITERDWEQHRCGLSTRGSGSNVTLDDLIQFLKNRADILETLIVSHSKAGLFGTSESKRQSNTVQFAPKVYCNVATNKSTTKSPNTHPRSRSCPMCNALHHLYACQQFLDLNVYDRIKFVKGKKLCINCMRSGHDIDACVFGPCRKCNQKHNTLICDVDSQGNTHTVTHVTSNGLSTVPGSSLDDRTRYSRSAQARDAPVDVLHAHSSPVHPVLLSTAIVEVSANGVYHRARAVLDSGSERSFITQSLCDKLNAQTIQSTKQIRGVGSSVTQSSQSCHIELKSRVSTFFARIQCLVLPQITSKLPTSSIIAKHLIIPNNITLADPSFFDSQSVDMLIGADLFWDLINEGRMRLPTGPYLQNTKLGWIVSGVIQSNLQASKKIVRCNFVPDTQAAGEDSRDDSLDTLLRKFWELEELPANEKSSRSAEQQACEEHFVQHTKRVANGRFSVRIPFKESPTTLGVTRAQAERRFYALEKRLQREPNYKKMYSDFLREYAELGHMTRVDTYATPHYFIPHHGVFREHAVTTKLRVVFDAGMASSTGVSLNSLQMVGAGIQGDLISILLRFRENRYVACADIEKMYRQVLIEEDQRDLQLILWREDPSEPLGVYRLNTVTYGTASAPFLSCRCLKQLAKECTSTLPEIAQTINEDFYVDDLCCSANSVQKLVDICNSVSDVLKSACLNLRKWVFNFNFDNPNVSEEISKPLALGDKYNNKTLGLGWNNKSDELNFDTQLEHNSKSITKRAILSTASQIFDPLGLLSPVITIAKALLQKCWLLKLDWDESVPSDVAQVWVRFLRCLSLLSSLRIPRHVACIDPIHIELHIFTDASQTAYGACAYIRTINDEGVTVRLLCAKGKVAPTKPVTIPKLELCGALLGARLYSKVSQSLRSQLHRVVFWTDSTIVLGWLGMPPNLLKTYVQNRTSEIHELTSNHPWRHVSGKDNPADLVSRGQNLDVLGDSSLWWEGPQFLKDPNFALPHVDDSVCENLPEIKSKTVLSHLTNENRYGILFPFLRFSQFNRMKRAAAFVLRFIHNTRNKSNRTMGSLTVDELRAAELTLARLSQQESFSDVYETLACARIIKRNAQLSRLNLFLDDHKIIRVGGRIQNSPNFDYNKRHPILLSSKHHFTLLLFRFEHRQTLHGAPQLLLFTLREAWWPTGGRALARRVVHACTTCARQRARCPQPIMGDLPRERLEPGFPFLRCGVDYAGPVLTLNRKGRGAKLDKSYICIFVCFVTRAVHLELVSDLSSDAYLLALKRFISRRGKPVEIFSDNGKNFVGVMNEFTNFLKACSDDIREYAASMSIKFRMIPFYASHFGGLWEAGVKSCKYHLRRVVGNAHLTFEELTTVLTQIEAILNSRPLTPLSSDPHDFLALSPGHFLVGRPLTAPLEADLLEVPQNRITRYRRVEQLRQHFWNRWAKEYVSELQTRSKWHHHKDDLKEDTLVLLKDDHLPPLKWSMGRITRVYPGADGVARVADVRTPRGFVRRAFSKLCPLPAPDA